MMEAVSLFLQLFVTFFVIGLFTFGGGYAMLSLIQTQVVTAHAWITESAFTDIVAISQMTPGPIGVNCATYVGYNVVTAAGGSHLLGVLGSFTATLAVVLPSFLLVLMMARFYEVMRHNRIFEGVMAWLRPAVVGLIGAAAAILVLRTGWTDGHPFLEVVRENFPDWKSWLLFGGALVASFYWKAGPILLIVAGGVIGFLIY